MLSSLDHTVRDGNSLIDDTFYSGQTNLDYYDAVQKERVNTFNWEEAFEEVSKKGGFDIIVSNPPYVKLQNFRTVHADMAEFLRDGRPGYKKYESTQTGNFDLYLPFIEKGIRLLNEEGRMGYIAPSMWTVNEYGAGLRNLVAEGRHLAGWIDFKSFQVFEESMIYTALQFYSRRKNDFVKVSFAGDGVVRENPWADSECELPYDRLDFGDRWLLLTGRERRLIDKLYENCKRLDDPENACQIYQGLITSADNIYHLERLGPGRFRCRPKGKKESTYEVALEEALMKPLVSGPDAKRYTEPAPNTYLLFPYKSVNGNVELIDQESIAKEYPSAWKYLQSWEKELRHREAKLDANGDFELDKQGNPAKAPFNDDKWYRFGRQQNLDKQQIQKLIVAQTVPSLRLCLDQAGDKYINNVRVNGIRAKTEQDLWFLLGILNNKVCDFVFRRIAKVKAGGYYEANKQFISPLPIPPAGMPERDDVVSRAQSLQAKHTARRDLLDQIARRMDAVKIKIRTEGWLFQTLDAKEELVDQAPQNLEGQQRRVWAERKSEEALQGKYDEITPRLYPGASLAASFESDELAFFIDNIPVIDRVFVEQDEGAFIVAQWRILAQTFSITEKTDGKKLCSALRRLGVTDNAALVKQIIRLEGQLSVLESEIFEIEAAMNTDVYQLYDLTAEDIQLVEAG